MRWNLVNHIISLKLRLTSTMLHTDTVLCNWYESETWASGAGVRKIRKFRGMETLEVIALWICGLFFTVKMYLLILSAMWLISHINLYKRLRMGNPCVTYLHSNSTKWVKSSYQQVSPILQYAFPSQNPKVPVYINKAHICNLRT